MDSDSASLVTHASPTNIYDRLMKGINDLTGDFNVEELPTTDQRSVSPSMYLRSDADFQSESPQLCFAEHSSGNVGLVTVIGLLCICLNQKVDRL